MRMLLANGADLLAVDVDGATAAHAFARSSSPQALVDWLRHPAAAATINANDAMSMTALHVATSDCFMKEGGAAVVEALLRCGADMSGADAHGKTPVGYARQRWKEAAESWRRQYDGWEYACDDDVYILRSTTDGGMRDRLLRVCKERVRVLQWHLRRPALAARLRALTGAAIPSDGLAAADATGERPVLCASPALSATIVAPSRRCSPERPCNESHVGCLRLL